MKCNLRPGSKQAPCQTSASCVFGVREAIFLSKPDLTCQTLEDVVFSAQADMYMTREQELMIGTGHPTLSTAQARTTEVLNTVGLVIDAAVAAVARSVTTRGSRKRDD